MLEKLTLAERLKHLPGVTVVDKPNHTYGNLCTCCGVTGGTIKGAYMRAHSNPQDTPTRANVLEIPDENLSLFIEWDDV